MDSEPHATEHRPDVSSLERTLAAARQAAHERNFKLAKDLFHTILDADPDCVEALTFLATTELGQGNPAGALAMLRRAEQVRPDDTQVRKNLAFALEAAGDVEGAERLLESLLAAEPGHYLGALHLGAVRERLGKRREAVHSYYRAVVNARSQGQWVSDETTPTWLRERVLQGMRVAQEGRRALLFEPIEKLKSEYGAAALARIEKALRIYLREIDADYPDPRQRPTFFYVPDLPTEPVFDNRLFPCIARLQDSFEAIAEEADNLLEQGLISEPFNRYRSAEQAKRALAGTRGTPHWNATFFFRHGSAIQSTHARCPRTSQALTSAPLCYIREHAPEVCFSLLTPGSHILPHRGVTNARSLLHLALRIPPDCALRVASRDLIWIPGQCFAFDDTFEHEAWNFSDRMRTVLIMDVWNPYLTEPEREGVKTVVQAIGDFNIACGLRHPLEGAA